MNPTLHHRIETIYPRAARVIVGLLLLIGIMAGQGQGGQDGGQVPARAAATPVPAARQADNIAVITIKGEIVATTLDSVKRRLTLAQRAGADAVVFELDTPGGDLGATLGISKAIKGSSIKNTVSWVHPEAYSGGAIIALATREMVISDPASMGDALPILAGGAISFDSLPEHERQKIMAPLLSDLVDSARRSGYDEILVQGIAARGVEVWLVEHTQTGDRLFITRDEYQTIFGEEPGAATPALASARPLERPAAPEGDAAKQDAPSRWDQFTGRKNTRRSTRNSSSTPDAPPAGLPQPDPNDPNRYIPARPQMDSLSGEITLEQELPTQRPRIGPDMRGEYRVVEYVATGDSPFVFTTRDMLRYDFATQIVQNDEELKAFFSAKQMLRLEPSWSEGLVAFLTMLPVKGVLIVLFLVGLFIEMVNPGLVLPGTVAALSLIALIAPPMLINMAGWWEVAAILGGIILILIELFVMPGFGFVGVIGLLLLFGGLIGTFIPSGQFFPDSAQQRSDLLYGVTTLVVSIASAGILMWFIARNFASIPIFGRLVLKQAGFEDTAGDPLLAAMAPAPTPVRVGAVGRSLTTLRPAGQIEVNGAVIDVVAELGYIGPGEQVKITSVTPFRIGVERA